MGKEIIAFGNIEGGKHKFHQHKTPISIYDLNDDRIVESNKVFWVKKLNILFCAKMIMKKFCPCVLYFEQ